MRGEESTSVQLRDDLMTMLIAGHETTAAVLTWAMFELSQQPGPINIVFIICMSFSSCLSKAESVCFTHMHIHIHTMKSYTYTFLYIHT
jgi:hypothetical protein